MPRFAPRFTTHYPVIGHTDRDVPFYTGEVIDGPVAETLKWLLHVLDEPYDSECRIVDHEPERDLTNWGPKPAVGSQVYDEEDLPF